MNSLGRMKKMGRGAGARQRRGDLAADDPGFSHSGRDHTSPTGEEQADRGVEPFIETIDKGENCRGLRLEHLACDG